MTNQVNYVKIGTCNEVAKPFGQTQVIYTTSNADPLTADDVRNAKAVFVIAELGRNIPFCVEIDKAEILERIRQHGSSITKYYFQDNAFEKYKQRPDIEYSIILGAEYFVAIDGATVT